MWNVIDFVYGETQEENRDNAHAVADFYGVECHKNGYGFEVMMNDIIRKDFDNEESIRNALAKINDKMGTNIMPYDFEIAM